MTRSERLSVLMRLRGMDPASLATASGCTLATVADILHGRPADWLEFRSLETVLGVEQRTLTVESIFQRELSRLTPTDHELGTIRRLELVESDISRLGLTDDQVITYAEAAERWGCPIGEAMARINRCVGQALVCAGRVGRFRLLPKEDRWK